LSEIFDHKAGCSPLLVSMPHAGEKLGSFAPRMTDAAKQIVDTDWHLPKLYDFLGGLDATVLSAQYSRYVVDLNRDPAGRSLYPGQNVTELCPSTTFDERPIYTGGEAPVAAEVAERVETYWRPYHAALQAEIARIKAEHGYVLLWDAHSIASKVPRFFSGRLPDFNLGTNDGLSCGRGLGETLISAARAQRDYSAVLNGRFKGGYITRTYGNPAAGVHAVQLELSQITYMDETFPFSYRATKADAVAGPIQALIEAMLGWAKNSVLK